MSSSLVCLRPLDTALQFDNAHFYTIPARWGRWLLPDLFGGPTTGHSELFHETDP